VTLGRTVHDLGIEAVLSLHTFGRSMSEARTQRVVFFVLDLDLAFREEPRRRGENIGCVLASAGL
jgi:hypothetical protein